MKLQELVNDICEELENFSLNSQRRRYLQSYLKEILEYQKNNPYHTGVPTSLQLFCDLNPEAQECRIYDD